ncbi:MAG: SpoIIE family protein phosphatase [Oscillospiraceae bacterium]|nr:SpoIIE family protein phosphatase [Oscillospiraceae bacterium]
MKVIRGIKVGGLQQKILALVLILLIVLVGTYIAVSVWQRRSLSNIVQESGARQQESITEVSAETMEAVLRSSMTRSTALQAYISDDLFGDVRSNVLMLQSYAEGLFANEERVSPLPLSPPQRANDGKTSVMVIHEPEADPEQSRLLDVAGNMSGLMTAMFDATDKLSGIYVGTADGNLLFVNDRAGAYLSPDGVPLNLDVRSRPWYRQAAKAGELIFTDVELDANTGIPTLECAAPVYQNGSLVAVVGADIFLTSISDYVERSTGEGSFLCVVNEKGQVLFSPERSGSFRAMHSVNAPDLRKNENSALADFVTRALSGSTGLELLSVDGKEYYAAGTPMPSAGWAVLSLVDRELTLQPTAEMLGRYDEINTEALESYRQGVKRAGETIIVLTALIIALALGWALVMTSRIVKPLETMTRRINALRDGDIAFEMEDTYRTKDEIEILAEAFATLSRRTRDYIGQIRRITAEKQRIDTELALATRIQADMLPSVFPPFPERAEFDLYALMDPAKEVGGDFYDFFLIDNEHLGLVMADVSGKGIPAALFMMMSKMLVQNCAKTGASPAEVLRIVNNQICANNREEMFVTVWFGVLDTRTGKIIAANAGHEYPVLMNAGGQFELVRDKHGFVIGGMEGVRYREYELQLTPGAKLFVYTDGVPEATSAEQELFGTERMLDALNSDTAASPEQVLKQVRAAVDGFVKEAEQFDDLTMLCLEYRGSE